MWSAWTCQANCPVHLLAGVGGAAGCRPQAVGAGGVQRPHGARRAAACPWPPLQPLLVGAWVGYSGLLWVRSMVHCQGFFVFDNVVRLRASGGCGCRACSHLSACAWPRVLLQTSCSSASCCRGYNSTLRFGLLPVSTFCNGHAFFVQVLTVRWQLGWPGVRRQRAGALGVLCSQLPG